MTRFTVIIPAYNAEKTLGRCLDSLLSQAREDVRILLIDDGSTDSTAAIAADYCRRDPRIQYIHQPNGGVSTARRSSKSWASGWRTGSIPPPSKTAFPSAASP